MTDDGVEVRQEVVTTWERHYLAGGGLEALLYVQAGEAVTPEMCVAVQCHLKASPKAALRVHRFAARARKRILPH